MSCLFGDIQCRINRDLEIPGQSMSLKVVPVCVLSVVIIKTDDDDDDDDDDRLGMVSY